MLQQRPILAALADLPRSIKLEKARAALDAARKADELATEAFRKACAKLRETDRWVANDVDARQAESAAIAAGAAARLAANEVEAAKRSHGETLAKHFAKFTPAALDALSLLLGEAHDAAQQIARAVAAAEEAGGGVPYKLHKVRRVLRHLQHALEAVK